MDDDGVLGTTVFTSAFGCCKWDSDSVGVGCGLGGEGIFSGFGGIRGFSSFLVFCTDSVVFVVWARCRTHGGDAYPNCYWNSDDDGEKQHHLDEVGLALATDGGVFSLRVGDIVGGIRDDVGRGRRHCRIIRASG